MTGLIMNRETSGLGASKVVMALVLDAQFVATLYALLNSSIPSAPGAHACVVGVDHRCLLRPHTALVLGELGYH